LTLSQIVPPRSGKLYWSQGDWYRNDEPFQREYDLAQ